MRSFIVRITNVLLSICLVLSALAILPVTPVRAASLTVNTLADEDTANALCSLREAILAANANAAYNGCVAGAGVDTINFSVTGTITLTQGELPTILSSLNIQGPGSSSLTIDADHGSRIFYIDPAMVVTISGLTLINGYMANSGGGGILNSGALTLDDIVMTGHEAHGNGPMAYVKGGAIYNNGTLTITNSTISNNKAWYLGGGIYSDFNTTLSLTNVTLDNNQASGETYTSGGAISLASDPSMPSSVTLNQVTITNNSATYAGGGIYIQDYATGTIQNSTISDNTVSANYGGGIYVSDYSSLNIINSAIDNNTALTHGGGISTSYADVNISGSSISGNTTTQPSNSDGGGIYQGNGTINISNSTIAANSTPSSGGGIYNASGVTNLTNVTIAGNNANGGGGIHIFGGTVNTTNSIIADNTGSIENDDCGNSGTLNSLGHNLIESTDGCTFTAATGDITGQDPILGTLANNGGTTRSMALLSGSPAINTGDDTACAAAPVNNTSQNGVTRPQGSHCDIGAFEKLAIVTPTFADVPLNAFAWAQIEAIYNAGITGGCSTNPLNYCPNNSVTRAQMAVFLLRGIHGSSYSPPPATGTVFGDVPSNAFAAAWIEQMVIEGITAGCGAGNYCPDNSVTRAQMAVFLLRAKYGAAYSPSAATGTVFTDIPSNAFAAAWIEQLVTEGVTSGCGGGNYCPNNAVTRAQMAVFLQRTFNLPLP